MDKPIAWYDPTNGMVSTDKDSPLFTPLGQVWPLHSQPEQEPVAWEQFYPEMGSPKLAYLSPAESPDNACYIPPQRTWVGLTDKEIEAIWEVAMFAKYGVGAELSNQPFVHYARGIEAKLKEKNT